MVRIHLPMHFNRTGENFILTSKGTICTAEDPHVALLGIANLNNYRAQDLLRLSVDLSPGDQRLLQLSLGEHSVLAERLHFARPGLQCKLFADDVNVAFLGPAGWSWTDSAIRGHTEAAPRSGPIAISAVEEQSLVLPLGPRLRPWVLAERSLCQTA